MTRTSRLVGAAAGAAVVGMALFASTAPAYPPYLVAWQDRYPTSTIPQRMQMAAGSECYTCHHPPGGSAVGSCYRVGIIEQFFNGLSIEDAIDVLHTMDSDGDGVANGAEILAPRADLPDQIGYHPGLIGPTGTDPCADDPLFAVTGMLETAPAVCRPDFNGDGTVNVQDFLAFLGAYAVGEPRADFTGDGVVNVQDFLAFLSAYAAGCA